MARLPEKMKEIIVGDVKSLGNIMLAINSIIDYLAERFPERKGNHCGICNRLLYCNQGQDPANCGHPCDKFESKEEPKEERPYSALISCMKCGKSDRLYLDVDTGKFICECLKPKKDKSALDEWKQICDDYYRHGDRCFGNDERALYFHGLKSHLNVLYEKAKEAINGKV
jgi:hypothetical protein